MVAAETKEDSMQPLTTIELATCTISELATLYCAIEAELWSGRKSDEERKNSLANHERIRLALAKRHGRSR
jgi:hypothetical protein